jgi:hypothetical protein
MPEPWLTAKVALIDQHDDNTLSFIPKWHIPNKHESSFANELLEIHIQLASDELVKSCQEHQDKSFCANSGG